MTPARLPRGAAHVGRRIGALLLALACGACTSTAVRQDWEQRLHGNAVILLGEVHDNAEQHALRLGALRRAFAAGWRPAIAMEQFDREHQADIARARREKPADAQHVIALAAPVGTRPGSGWNWDLYRPFVALALEYDVPLIAANLSNGDTSRIVKGGYTAVFDAAAIADLGLAQPIAADWQAAHESAIDAGHCHALPPAVWPRMARAQLARDAVMAEALRSHAGPDGVVLLAGNGHVRRDIGVPRWLGAAWQDRLFAVGYLETDDDATPTSIFDAVVRTAPTPRADPCAEFMRRDTRK
jgi:uncharacterized iron-regulated protein